MTDASSLVPIRELVGFALGGGWGSDQPGDDSVEVAVIRGTDFKRVIDGAFTDLPVRYESAKRAERRFLRENDIVLEVSGGSSSSGQPTGRSLLVTRRILEDIGRPTIPASFCRLIRIDPDVVDPRYAYHALQDMYKSGRVREYEHQSTGISNFQFEYFLDAELVRLPPLGEQSRIADVLSALDDKIELNRRMNRTLESIARAIFKTWFVDFDPVRNKMAAGEVGLPPDLAALFPATLVESDFGPVPEGWSFGSLLDVARLNPESWSAAAMPGTIAYVDLTGAKYGRIDTISSYTAETAPSRARRVLRSGDTIVGTVRPGNSSYALVGETGLTGSTGFAVLRPHEPRYREIVYLAATASDNIEMLALLADGGAYPAVHPGLVAETPLVLAPPKIAAAFSMLVGPMLDRVAASERESRTLIRLRDALLPKLLSGELTPDALLASTATKEAR